MARDVPIATPLVLPAEAARALRFGPVMTVDLAAICENYRRLAARTRGMTAAVVKGDAYGHGMLPASLALQEAGARLFFAARLDDAFLLRDRLLPSSTVAVLDGAGEATMDEAVAAGIVPVLNSPAQLVAAVSAAQRRGARVRAFVHIDTAMNRLGFDPAGLGRWAADLRSIDVLAYMTHFAGADDLAIDLCRAQVRRLKAAVAGLAPAPLSIANSSGLFLGTAFHGQITRPGKSTFGINPLPQGANPMSEPATVLAPVVQVRRVEKGQPVGYSSTWRAPARTRIAVLAIGYANGYRRSASNRGEVAFGGLRAPVIGRVSMDLTAVDIGGLPDGGVHVGAMAEIVGPTISYRELALSEETNEHEALIALGSGCRRIHLDSAGTPQEASA